MAMWMVRGGRYGEHENAALSQQLAIVGWEEMPDMSKVNGRDALLHVLADVYAGEKPKRLSNWRHQLWALINSMQVGDLVLMPLKHRAAVAVGRVTGGYDYRNGQAVPHVRPVSWQTELPRSAFDADLLYSLGAFLTVCRIQRNDAEARVLALLEGRRYVPRVAMRALGAVPGHAQRPGELHCDELTGDAREGLPIDLEQAAEDQLRLRIEQRFKGHRLEALVDAILQAQGFSTWRTGKGPDSGIDILAGEGQFGFGGLRIAVQVKSESGPIERTVLTQLKGAMQNVAATQGLLVAWGGFKRSVMELQPTEFFNIRLWDSQALLENLKKSYTRLPADIQAELPLKQVWMLVPDEEDEAV